MILKNLITTLLHFFVAIIMIIITTSFYSSHYNWVYGLYLYLFVTFIVYNVIPKHHIKGIRNIFLKDFILIQNKD